MGRGTMFGTRLFSFIFKVLFPYVVFPGFLLIVGYVLFFIWPTIWPLLFKPR